MARYGTDYGTWNRGIGNRDIGSRDIGNRGMGYDVGYRRGGLRGREGFGNEGFRGRDLGPTGYDRGYRTGGRNLRGAGYDRDFGDRLRRGWNELRGETREFLGRGYDRGW